MDERLSGLWQKASNAPAPLRPPASLPPHQLVKAIAQGFGPVVREQLDAANARIAALEQALADMTARLNALEAKQAPLLRVV